MIGLSRPLPSIPARSTSHLTITAPPAGGEPTVGQTEVTLLGYAQLGLIGRGRATRFSSVSSLPRPGTRVGSRWGHISLYDNNQGGLCELHLAWPLKNKNVV